MVDFGPWGRYWVAPVAGCYFSVQTYPVPLRSGSVMWPVASTKTENCTFVTLVAVHCEGCDAGRPEFLVCNAGGIAHQIGAAGEGDAVVGADCVAVCGT